jgi:ribosome-binding factor A
MVERHFRVAEEIKKIISELISNEIKGNVKFFSIPHLELSKDLSYAKIYLSFFSNHSTSDFEKINKAKGFIRSRLSSKIKLKKVPELTFILDESVKNGSDIIDKINALDISESNSE